MWSPLRSFGVEPVGVFGVVWICGKVDAKGAKGPTKKRCKLEGRIFMRLRKFKMSDSRLVDQKQFALLAGWRRLQAGKLRFRTGLQWLCGGAAGRLQCLGGAAARQGRFPHRHNVGEGVPTH